MRDQADNVRHRLLDRELRSDGRPHRRLVTVAPQQTLTDEAYQRCATQRSPSIRAVGVETGGSNIQFARRARRPGEMRRDRDEPACLALLGARVEGDRLSDREGRGAARGRLHARRDPERPHRRHPRELRADARLRRRQDAALCLREVPGGRRALGHAHEVGRRVDGDRPHLRRGLRQGDALARARQGAAAGCSRRRAARAPRACPIRSASRRSSSSFGATPPSTRCTSAPRSTRGSSTSSTRSRATRKAPSKASARFAPSTPARGVRGGTPYYYSTFERGDERRHAGEREVVDPRERPEPHRPGHRVRLLLRPRRRDRARARAARP